MGKKTREVKGEVIGRLEEITIYNGFLDLKDLKVVIDGRSFYKRNWEDVDKENLIKEINNYLGRKVGLKFEEVSTSLFYFFLDRIHKIKIPKRYKEITCFYNPVDQQT